MNLLAFVKNMRAILYLKEKDENFLKFVLRYNRRRSIGVPDFMEMPEGKCFVKLEIPSEGRKFYLKLGREGKAVFLSMLYIAPILTTPSNLTDFEKFEITPILANNSLDIREGLRHLRISEYSMLDYRLSNGKDLQEYIAKDLKRFWRIKDGKVKVGSYCTLDVPEQLSHLARGYAIVIGIEVNGSQ
ncbi:MAG TPA: hypothetical protein ENL42_05315 [Thermoplasmatales archaeon]|nr:hypothetical protein [Thermoplasmatales archaeon]